MIQKNGFGVVGIIIVGVIIVGSIGSIFIVNTNKNNLIPKTSPQVTNVKVVPTIKKAVPMMTLSFDPKTTSVKINKPFELFVYADSVGESISGYDIVLIYSGEGTAGAKLNFVSTQSLRSDFTIVPTVKDNMIIITGVKKLEAEELSRFNKEKIISIKAVVRTTGKINLEMILAKPNLKASSKMINERNQDVLRKVEGIKIDVN